MLTELSAPLAQARDRYQEPGARELDDHLADRAESGAPPMVNLALVGLALAATVAVALGLTRALPIDGVAWGLGLPLLAVTTLWTGMALRRTHRRARALSRGTLVGAHPVETPGAGRRLLVFSTAPQLRFDREWLQRLADRLSGTTGPAAHPRVSAAMRQLEAATGGLRRLPAAVTDGAPAFLAATRDRPAPGVQPAIYDHKNGLLIPV